MSDARFAPDEVKEFLYRQTLYCFDPITLAYVANVQYRQDWTCLVTMKDSSQDQGKYGFEGNLYWTKYTQFRQGATHWFSLERMDENAAQAWFADGTRAFVQSPLAQPPKL